jgi:tRNA (cytidine/uridine-2'-O-)-methyltransferase
VIHPCGFVWDDAKLKRSGMDYVGQAAIEHHNDWASFVSASAQHRLLLLTTKARVAYHTFSYQAGDILLLGRESSGVPEQVHEQVSTTLRLPMTQTSRSLNMAIAGAVVLAEALRQQEAFPSF